MVFIRKMRPKYLKKNQMDKDFIKKQWIITTKEKAVDNYTGTDSYNISEWLITCTTGDLQNVMLDLRRDYEILNYFEYKSDEYFMYKEGDNYDVNKNYNEVS